MRLCLSVVLACTTPGRLLAASCTPKKHYAAGVSRRTGKVLGSTVAENAALLAELLPGTAPVAFKPSIPNLIYQVRTLLFVH